jgi:hypothetical protein
MLNNTNQVDSLSLGSKHSPYLMKVSMSIIDTKIQALPF